MPPIVENLSVDIQHNIQKLCFFSRIEDLGVTPIADLAVFVGLISMLAGSALQDDIVETTRALRRKGEEILGKNVS
jgi:hypothetical protein